MSFGTFAGGAAGGLSRGVDLNSTYETTQANKAKEARTQSDWEADQAGNKKLAAESAELRKKKYGPAAIVARIFGKDYHDLAKLMDPNFVPEVEKNDDYEPGGSSYGPRAQESAGPAGGMQIPLTAGEM